MSGLTATELLEKLGDQPSYGAKDFASLQVADSCSLLGAPNGAGIIDTHCSSVEQKITSPQISITNGLNF